MKFIQSIFMFFCKKNSLYYNQINRNNFKKDLKILNHFTLLFMFIFFRDFEQRFWLYFYKPIQDKSNDFQDHFTKSKKRKLFIFLKQSCNMHILNIEINY